MDASQTGFLASGTPCAQLENKSTTSLGNNTIQSLEDSFFFVSSEHTSTPKLFLTRSTSSGFSSMGLEKSLNSLLPSALHTPCSISPVCVNRELIENRSNHPHNFSILEGEMSDFIPDSQGDYDIQSNVSMNRRKKSSDPYNSKYQQIQSEILQDGEQTKSSLFGRRYDVNGKISIDERSETFASTQQQNINSYHHKISTSLPEEAFFTKPLSRNSKPVTSAQFSTTTSEKSTSREILNHFKSSNVDANDDEVLIISPIPLPEVLTNSKILEIDETSHKLHREINPGNRKRNSDLCNDASHSNNSSLSFNQENRDQPNPKSEPSRNWCNEYQKEINVLVEDFYALLCYRASLLPPDGSASLQCRLKIMTSKNSENSECERYDFNVGSDKVHSSYQKYFPVGQTVSQRKDDNEQSNSSITDVSFSKQDIDHEAEFKKVTNSSKFCDVEPRSVFHHYTNEEKCNTLDNKMRSSSCPSELLKESEQISDSSSVKEKIAKSFTTNQSGTTKDAKCSSKLSVCRSLLLNSRKKDTRSNSFKMCVSEHSPNDYARKEPKIYEKLSNVFISSGDLEAAEKLASESSTTPSHTISRTINSDSKSLSTKAASNGYMQVQHPKKGRSVCNANIFGSKDAKRAWLASTSYDKLENTKKTKMDQEESFFSSICSQHFTKNLSPDIKDDERKRDSTANEIRYIYKKIKDLTRTVTEIRHRTGLIDPPLENPESSPLTFSVQKSLGSDHHQRDQSFKDIGNRLKRAHPISSILKVDMTGYCHQPRNSHQLYHEDQMLKGTPPLRLRDTLGNNVRI